MLNRLVLCECEALVDQYSLTAYHWTVGFSEFGREMEDSILRFLVDPPVEEAEDSQGPGFWWSGKASDI